MNPLVTSPSVEAVAAAAAAAAVYRVEYQLVDNGEEEAEQIEEKFI